MCIFISNTARFITFIYYLTFSVVRKVIKNVNACSHRSTFVNHTVCVCVCDFTYELLAVIIFLSSYQPVRKSSSSSSPASIIIHIKASALLSVSRLETVHSSHTSRCLVRVDSNQRWHGGTICSATKKRKRKQITPARCCLSL